MNDVIKIAQAARKEMEQFALDYPEAGGYSDLEGYCAISSYFLKILARKLGYNLTLIEGMAFENYVDPDGTNKNDINHCWITYKGKIIDLTATQFGSKRKVHIVNVSNKNYIKIRVANISKSFKTWPYNQSPDTFKKELRNRASHLVEKMRVAA